MFSVVLPKMFSFASKAFSILSSSFCSSFEIGMLPPNPITGTLSMFGSYPFVIIPDVRLSGPNALVLFNCSASSPQNELTFDSVSVFSFSLSMKAWLISLLFDLLLELLLDAWIKL